MKIYAWLLVGALGWGAAAGTAVFTLGDMGRRGEAGSVGAPGLQGPVGLPGPPGERGRIHVKGITKIYGDCKSGLARYANVHDGQQIELIDQNYQRVGSASMWSTGDCLWSYDFGEVSADVEHFGFKVGDGALGIVWESKAQLASLGWRMSLYLGDGPSDPWPSSDTTA
jgi:hypothetical protein